MLNEERVKHMVKLAFYETNGGNEELKICCRRKKDYVGANAFWTFFWLTIAYGVLMFFLKVTFLNDILKAMSKKELMLVLASVVGLYIVLLITYLVKEIKISKIKHAKAYHHVKRFKEDLAELEELYAKEDVNE